MEQLHEHRSREFIPDRTGRKAINPAARYGSGYGVGQGIVGLWYSARTGAEVSDHVAKILLYKRALLVIEQLQAVIDFGGGDYWDEHRIIQCRQRICF